MGYLQDQKVSSIASRKWEERARARYTRDRNDDIEVDRYSQGRHIDNMAHELLRKLGGDEGSIPFICKALLKLSEAHVVSNVEQALKGRNPMGLFIWLCKRDGV